MSGLAGLGPVLAQSSAPTTNLGGRLLGLLVLLLLLGGGYLLMLKGWRGRRRRQGDVPEPNPLPVDRTPLPDGPPVLVGRYYGSTTAGQWLDRVVAHGLGTRSAVTLTLTRLGVAVDREGAQGFLIPTTALTGVRLEKGIAGKVTEAGGLLVLTWSLGDRELDSGFRSEHPDEHRDWVAALAPMVGESDVSRADARDRAHPLLDPRTRTDPTRPEETP